MRSTGICLIIIGYFFNDIIGYLFSDSDDGLWFLGMLVMALGAFLFWRGRQYMAQSIANRVLYDSKPDVLYLRAFETDPSLLHYLGKVLFIHNTLRSMLSGTEEEQLREALEPFGDLIAIGRPGETLPIPGAARLYTSDAEWKEVVTTQMESARLVVIRAGLAEGVLWEIKRAVQVINPKKLVILILKMSQKKYETFRKEAEQSFGHTFPKANEIRRFWRVSGFIKFSANWQPTFLPLQIPYSRGSVYKPYRRLFQYVLRPVFVEYGLQWQPPRLSILRVLAMGWWCFLLLFFFLILLFGLRNCSGKWHCNWEELGCSCETTIPG